MILDEVDIPVRGGIGEREKCSPEARVPPKPRRHASGAFREKSFAGRILQKAEVGYSQGNTFFFFRICRGVAIR